MPKYNKVTPELIEKLYALLGKHNMTTDPEKLDTYKTDEETNPIYFHTPEVVVFPETTEQVAGIMKLANEYVVPVTPRGGGSSLAAQAIPVLLTQPADLLLELSRGQENLVIRLT